jgi:hypothetical protein
MLKGFGRTLTVGNAFLAASICRELPAEIRITGRSGKVFLVRNFLLPLSNTYE